jgi:hypothetical protein
MLQIGLQRAELDRCYDGYTLFTTTEDNDSYLIDMEGQLVHRWPTLRSQLSELRPNGNLIYGGYGRVCEIDWEGNVLWGYPCDYHHDFAPTVEGRIMILVGCMTRVLDRPDVFQGCSEGLSFVANNFMEIDPKTFSCTWRWWAHEHIDELRPLGIEFPRPIDERSKGKMGDIFHCNTLQVLPDTEIGRRDSRFRAGNVMFSYRQIDVIGVVDRDSGDIVWAWGPGELDGQHQPTLIPDVHPLTGEAMPGAGHILVFDNGRYRRDYSRVLEIDPISNEILWSSPTDWHSWHISGAQRLPNGNTFICDGPAGRLFEITPEGETVWEYLNPFARRIRLESLTGAAFDDTGGVDTDRSIYRAARYPRQYVDEILWDDRRKLLA